MDRHGEPMDRMDRGMERGRASPRDFENALNAADARDLARNERSMAGEPVYADAAGNAPARTPTVDGRHDVHDRAIGGNERMNDVRDRNDARDRGYYDRTPERRDVAAVAAPATTTAYDDPDDRVAGRRNVAYAAPEPGFHVGATFLGWAVASFFTLLFSTLLLLGLGANAAPDATDGVMSYDTLYNLSTTGAILAGVGLLVAYFLGGYAAARMADGGSGVAHGLGVVGWTVLFAILAGVLGAYAADQFNLLAYTPFALDWSAITNNAIIGAVVALVLMCLGAILGGILGQRHFAGYGRDAYAGRRAARGRPL